jgi:hypothetical protein
MGYQGSPLYYNAVYFYLHFQINGWFSFAVLALLYRCLEDTGFRAQSHAAFQLFHIACVPAYFLSVLWNSPGVVFNIIGGAAALLQVAALVFMLKDIKSLTLTGLMKLAMTAFVIKICLQLASALPSVATMAYENRNFVIAYLHLALLGFISLFLFSFFYKKYPLQNIAVQAGTGLFLVSFISTELLLVLFSLGNVLDFGIKYYYELLHGCSLLFPAGLLMIVLSIQRIVRKQLQCN